MKKISIVLMVMLLVGLFAGCSNGTTASEATASAGDSGEKLVEEFLSEPLHIIVPYAAGGGADITVRLTAKYLAEELGTEVVVDNKPGAGGVVASTEYLTEKANTRTILFTNSSLMSYVPKSQNTAYNRADFEAISSLQVIQFALYTSPDNTGIESIEDLQAYAKENRIIFGSPGVGKPLHGSQAKIYTTMGAENETLTYEHGNQGIVNLLANDTQILATGLSVADQFVQEGTVVPLVMLSAEDYDGPYGKIPSIYNYGYNYSNDMLTMFVTRAGTDDAIVDHLYNAFASVVENEEYQTEIEKASNLEFKVMDREGVNSFLDEMDKVTDQLLAE